MRGGEGEMRGKGEEGKRDGGRKERERGREQFS